MTAPTCIEQLFVLLIVGSYPLFHSLAPALLPAAALIVHRCHATYVGMAHGKALLW